MTLSTVEVACWLLFRGGAFYEKEAQRNLLRETLVAKARSCQISHGKCATPEDIFVEDFLIAATGVSGFIALLGD